MVAPVIFLDLDGTLIGPPGDVHPELWPALDAARQAGTALCVCTGRPSGGLASRIAARLGPDLPHIYHGGAVIMTGRGDVVRAEAMPRPALREMVARARAEGLTLELYTADAIHVDEATWMHRRHLSLLDLDGRVCDLAALVETATIVKAQWMIEDEALADRLEREVPPACFAASAGSHAMSKVHFITVTRDGVDKGDAVRWVAARLGVDVAACAAVGDSSGDVPMLEAVGRPYVMADAPAWLRARFAVLPSVAEHGVMSLFAAGLGL